MGICPLCNGLEDFKSNCPSCGDLLEDRGRLMDFFDDYSPYMPIDLMKLEDGFQNDDKDEKCPHLLQCPQCGYDEVRFFLE